MSLTINPTLLTDALQIMSSTLSSSRMDEEDKRDMMTIITLECVRRVRKLECELVIIYFLQSQ